MSVLRQAFGFGKNDAEQRRLDPFNSGDNLADYGRVGMGSWAPGMAWQTWPSTAAVSTDAAMRMSAVFACLRLLSEAIATLPLDTFIRLGGTRRPYRPRPEYLSFQPPMISRTTYLSQVMLSLLTAGDAFVATPRDDMGTPTGLIPLDPSAVGVRRESNGRMVYVIADQEYSTLDVLHIQGMTLPDQLRGVSPITAAREVIDGGRKAQEFGRNVMGNYAVPPAVIEVPGAGGEPAAERERAKRIAAIWQESNTGANAGKVGVLTGGAKLTSVAMSPEDAQWLESKRFGVSEIARFFGVPPHLIADASNSTSWGSGLAEQNLAFGQFSLRPWTERIEEAHGRLLTTHGMPDVFMKLNLDALLRASLSDRYASYATGIEHRFLTPNEARTLEDLSPLPGGDSFAAAPPGGAP